jgi:hypothetical protein
MGAELMTQHTPFFRTVAQSLHGGNHGEVIDLAQRNGLPPAAGAGIKPSSHPAARIAVIACALVER